MFQNAPLEEALAVGAVTSRSVRVWARAEGAGPCELRCWSADGSAEICRTGIDLSDAERDFTGSVEINQSLDPDCGYRVSLHGGSGETLAAGRFRTAPDAAGAPPERYALALMSCHEPFDADGAVTDVAQASLEAARTACQRHDVRQVIMAGDQLYSDMPSRLSLFDPSHFESVAPPGRSTILDCDAGEVRRLFHRRYRHFWSVPGWRALMSEFPCYPILDDHEIVDNWGSAVEHRAPEWQAFRAGAFLAYCDYQHSLVSETGSNLPADLDYQIEFADSATYVMDLRSNRRVGDGPRIFSPQQLGAFEGFLAAHRDKRVVFVVLSVPPVHLPRKLTQLAATITPDGEDFSDRWSSRGHQHDRDRLLHALRRHQQQVPEQRVVLLSGDIHIGCLHELRWRDDRPSLHQFISSGITHDAGTLTQVLSSLIIRANRQIELEDGSKADIRLVGGERGARNNPCGELNFGVVEVEQSGDGRVLRFLLYGNRGHEPALRYRSPPIRLARCPA